MLFPFFHLFEIFFDLGWTSVTHWICVSTQFVPNSSRVGNCFWFVSIDIQRSDDNCLKSSVQLSLSLSLSPKIQVIHIRCLLRILPYKIHRLTVFVPLFRCKGRPDIKYSRHMLL